MSTLALVLIVAAIVLLILIAGGWLAITRRQRSEHSALLASVAEADQALALAGADDRGWQREALEVAVRRAFAERSPAAVRELLLVRVSDRPGIDEDEALFRVITDAGAEDVRLVRSGGEWHAG